jgi:hypothetical protein
MDEVCDGRLTRLGLAQVAEDSDRLHGARLPFALITALQQQQQRVSGPTNLAGILQHLVMNRLNLQDGCDLPTSHILSVHY